MTPKRLLVVPHRLRFRRRRGFDQRPALSNSNLDGGTSTGFVAFGGNNASGGTLQAGSSRRRFSMLSEDFAIGGKRFSDASANRKMDFRPREGTGGCWRFLVIPFLTRISSPDQENSLHDQKSLQRWSGGAYDFTGRRPERSACRSTVPEGYRTVASWLVAKAIAA